MTARIPDEYGHRWPVTGSWCPECDMPTDPVLDGGPHPACAPPPELAPDEEGALALLADQLGATLAAVCTECGSPFPDATSADVALHLACWRTRRAPRRRP